jgi:hypothetical protein
MAENKTINIKINQNADKAEKSFKSYNKELGNTKKQYDAVLKSGKPFDQQLEDINRIVKETPLNVRDMNKQIQAYQSIALSAGRETPVGRKALEEAAALRDRYIDIQNETKRLADDQRTLEGAMQGVATGVAVYGGIQSAMALSGVESEKLRETLVKLQAAQTLMNSINQVATAFEKESALMLTLKAAKTKAVTVATAAYATVTGTTTGALKLFRIALASTGIGAIVVGLGLLIANFGKVTEFVKKAVKSFDELGGVMKIILFPITAIIEGFKLVQKGLEAIGVLQSEEEKQALAREDAKIARANQRIKEIDEEIEAINRRIAAREKEEAVVDKIFDLRRKQAKNIQELNEVETQARDKALASIEKREQELIETVTAQRDKLAASLEAQQARINKAQIQGIAVSKKALDAQTQGYKELERLNARLADRQLLGLQELNVEREALELEYTETIKANNKKRADSYRQYRDTRLQIARQIEDLENELLKDGIEKDLLLNEVKFRRLRENTEKNTKLTAEERKELNDLYLEQEKQSEAEIRLKYFNEEKQILSGIVDFRTELRNKEIEDNKKAADSIIKTNEIARKKDLENEKAVAEAKKGIQDAQIANVEAGIALLKDVSGENNKLQALAIAAENAVGIAKIIISTQAANAAAKLKYAAIPGGLALAAAEITANKISAGIGIAASVAAAAKGIASLKASAPLDSGGDLGGGGVGSEAVAPEFNVVGESGINQLAQLQQQPTQAFVVSGEVTSAQALDRNRVTNATL